MFWGLFLNKSMRKPPLLKNTTITPKITATPFKPASYACLYGEYVHTARAGQLANQPHTHTHRAYQSMIMMAVPAHHSAEYDFFCNKNKTPKTCNTYFVYIVNFSQDFRS